MQLRAGEDKRDGGRKRKSVSENKIKSVTDRWWRRRRRREETGAEDETHSHVLTGE